MKAYTISCLVYIFFIVLFFGDGLWPGITKLTSCKDLGREMDMMESSRYD